MKQTSILLAALLLLVALPPLAAEVKSPSEFLGFEVGADRQLADYRQIVRYFRHLEEGSPRVELTSLGKTTLGEEMVMAVISAEENMERLPRLKEISRRLADPRGLSQEETDALVREGRTVVLVTCNIHSTEIASSQMAMEWAHALATADDEETRRRLANVVLLLVPSLNPDGQLMETEWYRKWVGTPYEGGRMPWLYHHYTGHDNNRDWFMLTQRETRAMSRAIYHEWFPQIFVDEHQMGSQGPRMFIPPFADPIDPDVHPLIWREVNLIGSNMALRLEEEGKRGLIYGYSFDAYWLGGTRNTGWWKNITGLLLEVASARMATPVYVEPTELAGRGKGLTEYGPQVNFPNPWRGGWWRMRDIMDYERTASDALHEIAAERRQDFLRNVATRARAAVAAAAPGEAYVIPAGQRDGATARRLAWLMADHNVDVFVAANGDYWIPLAQPYGLFVREMLDVQRYPEVRLTGAKEILPPYDVASWTLPLMMGVEARKTTMPAAVARRVAAGEGKLSPSPDMRVDGRSYAESEPEYAAPADSPYYAIAPASAERPKVVNDALTSRGRVWIVREGADGLPPGTVVMDRTAFESARYAARETRVEVSPIAALTERAAPIRRPRVGIYKPWAASMDEGWTRWLLEQYGFELTQVDNRAAQSGTLSKRLDVLILPDVTKDVIATGRPKRDEGQMKYFADFPPEYRGGIGEEGAKAIRRFVEQGGTLIALGAARGWVIENFNIPVRNALEKVSSSEFSAPGSLVRVSLRGDHPVTWGLPAEMAVFLDTPAAFETQIPGPEVARTVLASYAAAPEDLLMSGWIRGGERIARRAAAVAVGYGRGKIVTYGFQPQNRAQTHGTFPFLFNAIYWGVME
jgi:hypothetical protein